MARLVAEADHLVRRAAWMAQRGITADAHAAGKCTKCGGRIFAMTAPRLAPGGPVAVSTLWDQGLVTAVQTCGRCPISHGNCRI